MTLAADDWVIGSKMDSAPEPWLQDERISNDAKRILVWLCQQARPQETAGVEFLSIVVFRRSLNRTELSTTERALRALIMLELAGYSTGDNYGALWTLTWPNYARPEIGADRDRDGAGRARAVQSDQQIEGARR